MDLLIIAGFFALLVYATQNGSLDLGSLMNAGRLNASQIAQLAQNAGFSGDDLVTAVAVALAESSGNPGTVGDLSITPGGSIGLWQINLKWHPEYTAAQLVDPQQNADAAFAIYNAAGGSFTPWSTFKTGAYLAYVQQAKQGIPA